MKTGIQTSAKSKRSNRTQRSSKSVKTAPRAQTSHSIRSAVLKKSSRSRKESLNTAREEVPLDKTQQDTTLRSSKQTSLQSVELTPQIQVSNSKILRFRQSFLFLETELQMEPAVLRFDSNGGLQKVKLFNPTSESIAIKTRCSDNYL